MNNVYPLQPIDTLPVNIEAECELVGAILADNDVLNFVAGTLRPEHFSIPANAEIYRLCRELVSQGRVASPTSLKTLVEPSMYPDNNPVRYMLKCASNGVSRISADDYGDLLIDLHSRRQLIQATDEIRHNAGSGSQVPTDRLIEDIEGILSALRAARTRHDETPQDIEDITNHCLQRILDVKSGEIDPFPSTGLKDLDRRIGGYEPGKMTIVGGRPGQGKTIFGVEAMRRTTRVDPNHNQSYGVAYFSLEVPSNDIWSRLIASETVGGHMPLAYKDIQEARHLTDADFEKVTVIGNRLKDRPMTIIDTPALTVSQIESRVRAIKQKRARNGGGLDIVIVDHIGHIKPSGHYKGQKVNEVAEITGSLLSLAKRLHVHVIGLSQLNRSVDARDSKMPIMSDLRDSGSIEQDANNIIFLYRPAYYEARDNPGVPPIDPNRIVLNVEKARDGMPGIFEAYVDVKSNHIADAARGME